MVDVPEDGGACDATACSLSYFSCNDLFIDVSYSHTTGVAELLRTERKHRGSVVARPVL
jgi:hypothetical protein